jgi:hypothetical protein
VATVPGAGVGGSVWPNSVMLFILSIKLYVSIENVVTDAALVIVLVMTADHNLHRIVYATIESLSLSAV